MFSTTFWHQFSLAIALPTSLESLNLQKGKKYSVNIPLKCRLSNRQDFLIRIMPLCVSEMITWWKAEHKINIILVVTSATSYKSFLSSRHLYSNRHSQKHLASLKTQVIKTQNEKERKQEKQEKREQVRGKPQNQLPLL